MKFMKCIVLTVWLTIIAVSANADVVEGVTDAIKGDNKAIREYVTEALEALQEGVNNIATDQIEDKAITGDKITEDQAGMITMEKVGDLTSGLNELHFINFIILSSLMVVPVRTY
ncbi:unnamed protein product [marine sediment metagenome]|uniref:Uncharacterized protein n=1 Tax=marine sediment metagenome TaxID=412755 RepID=X1CKZ3_9ZZZZ